MEWTLNHVWLVKIWKKGQHSCKVSYLNTHKADSHNFGIVCSWISQYYKIKHALNSHIKEENGIFIQLSCRIQQVVPKNTKILNSLIERKCNSSVSRSFTNHNSEKLNKCIFFHFRDPCHSILESFWITFSWAEQENILFSDLKGQQKMWSTCGVK